MDTTRVALACATLSLGALTGCGGHAPSAGASASTAAAGAHDRGGTSSPALPTGAAPLLVTRVSHSGEMARIEFNQEVSESSVLAGLRVYEDVDLDAGGAFRGGAWGSWLDPNQKTVVVFTGAGSPHEVRLVLTDTIRTPGGQHLSGGAEGASSAALSFPQAEPGAVFELRFRPAPLPPSSPSGAALLAHNTSDDHGDSLSDATPLSLGPGLAGAIEVAADRDWFALDLLAGRPVTLRTATSGDTILNLYDARGGLLATNDDDPAGGRHSVLTHTPQVGGPHYAEVRGYGQSTPAYQVSLDGPGARPGAGTDAASARVVQLGEAVADVLAPGGADWFALDIGVGFELRIEADHPDVCLMALDSNQRPFAEPVHVVAAGETLGSIARLYGLPYPTLAALNGISDPNRIALGQRLHVPQRGALDLQAPGGRLYLRASGFEGAAPAYTVSFRGAASAPPPPTRTDDHGQDAASASALRLGAAQSGVIEVSGDRDWFALDLQAGKTYELETTTQGDTVLRLLDASGQELARNDDAPGGGRHSFLSHRALRDGRCYAEVSAYGGATLRYALALRERALAALPDPSRFRPRAGSDVWHIDFRLRADLFAADLAAHGLASGDPETDRLMRERVMDELLAALSEKYRLGRDGGPTRGVSWKVSFTATAPSGRPGRDHSREAVGGSHEDGSRTLGVSYLDPGNRRREDNDDLARLGIFSASIDGRDSTLRPGLSAADRRFLDGSYLLGDGSSSDDARFRRLRVVSSDWAHALAVVTAHEVGHSVGLDHDESERTGIMQAALSRSVLSSDTTRFAAASARTLDDSLEVE